MDAEQYRRTGAAITRVPDESPDESITLDGHAYVHVAACPCRAVSVEAVGPAYAEPMEGDVWAVGDSNDEGRWLLFAGSRKQADYAVMLLNSGGVEGTFSERRDQIEELTERTVCSRCNRMPFRGEVDADGRCPACQP